MLLTLPNELLIEIVGHLARDVEALRCCALTCRLLLPVVREELFAVLNILALERAYMHPYLPLTRQLRVGPGYESDILTPRAFPALNPQALPNLTALSVVGLNFVTHTRLHSPMYNALENFTSITDLCLTSVVFLHLKHIQSLVCALPNLSSLSLRSVTYEFISSAAAHVQLAKDVDDLAMARPRLSSLSIFQASFSMASRHVAAWLAHSPTGESLKVLTIPQGAQGPEEILRHFGPSVEHLNVPVQNLAGKPPCHIFVSRHLIRPYPACIFDDYLRSYTSLRSLEVSLDVSDSTRDQWDVLFRLFQHAIVADHLHTITIVFRLEHSLPMRLRSALRWDTFGLVEEELISTKFKALRTVDIVVLWTEDWSRSLEPEVESLLRKIRRHLSRLSAQMILVTRHLVLQEVCLHAYDLPSTTNKVLVVRCNGVLGIPLTVLNNTHDGHIEYLSKLLK